MRSALAVRRLLDGALALAARSGETDDQALLLAVMALRGCEWDLPPVVVDAEGALFATLHGYVYADSERPLCTDDYFACAGGGSGCLPRIGRYAPSVLHFNGNGKRVFASCRRAFERAQRPRVAGGPAFGCSWWDADAGLLRRVAAASDL